MNIYKKLLFGFLIILGFSEPVSAEAHLNKIPDFLLDNQVGTTQRLSDLQGRVVLINFWATWCRPCRIEMPILEKLHQQYKGSGLSVLGINIEDSRNSKKKLAIDEVVTDMDLSFTILYDHQKNVVRNIEKSLLGKNIGVPTTIFIDRKGNTRYLHQGYRNGDDKKYQSIIEKLINEAN